MDYSLVHSETNLRGGEVVVDVEGMWKLGKGESGRGGLILSDQQTRQTLPPSDGQTSNSIIEGKNHYVIKGDFAEKKLRKKIMAIRLESERLEEGLPEVAARDYGKPSPEATPSVALLRRALRAGPLSLRAPRVVIER